MTTLGVQPVFKQAGLPFRFPHHIWSLFGYFVDFGAKVTFVGLAIQSLWDTRLNLASCVDGVVERLLLTVQEFLYIMYQLTFESASFTSMF